MGLMKEFKEFAIKGNVVDLAVGIMIGAAFTTIVNSVIQDLVMPVIASIIGSPDFSNAYIDLKGQIPPGTPLAKAKELGPVFAYGNFITVIINFLLLTFAIFMIVKAINRIRRKTPPPPPPEMSTTDKLLSDIRDSLRNQKIG
jgi:large conductance mechanosensitive channel